MMKINRKTDCIFFRICTLTLFLNVISAFGVNGLHAQTIIHGKIDPSFKIDSFTIAYTKDPVQENNIYAKGEEKTVKVTDGLFNIELTDLSQTFYILFRFPEVDIKLKSDSYRAFAGNPFLLKSNTSTNIRISPQEVSFQGENEAMLDCQLALNQLQSDLNTSKINIKSQYDFNNKENIEGKTHDFLHKLKAICDQIEKRGTMLVENDYHDIPVSIRNQILYNFIGLIRIWELRTSYFSAKNDLRISRYVIDYYLQNYLQYEEDQLVSNFMGKSPFFASYLLSKITFDLWMATSRIGKKISINLALILDVAVNRFQGEVYDQVAFAAYMQKTISQDIDESNYIRLYTSIDNPELRAYIKKDYESKKSNEKSFQFRLINESGEYTTNADFKGKAVLFDFWFTGCSGCISLHKKMKPIKEHFKDNPNVVFVSVCVDPKEEHWKKSILSGKYTDDRDIKLWVGSGKLSHPLIRHYNIASYPTMVLVNANDELMMVNPPRPTDEKKGRELIFRIEQALLGNNK